MYFFLFIFISAFSCGAYTSISNSIKEFSHSSFKKELKQDGSTAASEDLVFEETENDSEEALTAEFNFLTSFLSFDLVAMDVHAINNHHPQERLVLLESQTDP